MASIDSDSLYEYIEVVLDSPAFQVPVMEFIDANCVIFDTDEESTFKQTDVHKDFAALVELLLEEALSDIGISPEEFTETAAGSPKLSHLVVQRILSVEDFQLFKKLMTKRNLELEVEALMALQSVMPVKSANEGALDEKSQLDIAIQLSEQLESLRNKEDSSIRDQEAAELELALQASLLDAEALRRARELETAVIEAAMAASLAFAEQLTSMPDVERTKAIEYYSAASITITMSEKAKAASDHDVASTSAVSAKRPGSSSRPDATDDPALGYGAPREFLRTPGAPSASDVPVKAAAGAPGSKAAQGSTVGNSTQGTPPSNDHASQHGPVAARPSTAGDGDPTAPEASRRQLTTSLVQVQGSAGEPNPTPAAAGPSGPHTTKGGPASHAASMSSSSTGGDRTTVIAGPGAHAQVEGAQADPTTISSPPKESVEKRTGGFFSRLFGKKDKAKKEKPAEETARSKKLPPPAAPAPNDELERTQSRNQQPGALVSSASHDSTTSAGGIAFTESRPSSATTVPAVPSPSVPTTPARPTGDMHKTSLLLTAASAPSVAPAMDDEPDAPTRKSAQLPSLRSPNRGYDRSSLIDMAFFVPVRASTEPVGDDAALAAEKANAEQLFEENARKLRVAREIAAKREGEVSEADIRARQERLQRQRDLLLAKKKGEREALLSPAARKAAAATPDRRTELAAKLRRS